MERLKGIEILLAKEEKLKQLERNSKIPEYQYKLTISKVVRSKQPRCSVIDPSLADNYIGYKDFRHKDVSFEARVGATVMNTKDKVALAYRSHWMTLIKKMIYLPDLSEMTAAGYYDFLKIKPSSQSLTEDDFDDLDEDLLDTVEVIYSMHAKIEDDVGIDHCLFGYKPRFSEYLDVENLAPEEILQRFV